MKSVGKKKEHRFPNALEIMFIIMIIAAILTWIIPAGTYETIADGKTLDPNSFHYLEQTPVSPWALLQSVFAGMNQGGMIVVFTFLIGGMFNVVTESGSIDAFIAWLIEKLDTRASLALPVLGVIMFLSGSTGIMANPVVAFIPIGMVLAKRLKMDQLVALGVMFLMAFCGYATSPICALTVQIAQQISGVPILSGFGFRCVISVVFLVPTLIYLVRYGNKVRSNPEASLMGTENFAFLPDSADKVIAFRWQHAASMLSVVIALVIYTYASLKYGWSLNEMVTVIILSSIFTALVTGMGVEGFVNAFLRGAEQMTFSAMLIGLASGVSVILNAGHILHTLVYGMGVAINSLPHVLAAPIMFWFNLLFNFLVNSGSGQAMVIMPIMAPLADVVGVTRQAAISAFQLGDGLSNVIFPTSGTLMGCLALANVDFKKWTKWVMPIFSLWVVLGTVVIIAIVALGVA